MVSCFYSVCRWRPCNGLIPRPRTPTDFYRIKKLKSGQCPEGCRAIEREREIPLLIFCVITANTDEFSYACVRDSDFLYETVVHI
jgi:hypothetical protein